MTFFPVVERELRVASRRRGTYWGRFVAAMLGVGLATWTVAVVEDSNPALGADLFAVVSSVVFVYAAFAGVLVTCDCLSEEKREGTLGLLFLTDLKGHDVVLGKLAATSVNAIYGMLAVVPILAIPFLLGGVTQSELLRVVLVSLNLLFFFLSLGLFSSAICRRDNWALGISIFIAMFFVCAGPVMEELPAFRHVAHAALLSSPAAGCFLAFDAAYNTKIPHSDFWTNAAVTNLYAWLFFALACRIVPRSWQDAPLGKRSRAQRRLRSEWHVKQRARLLNKSPYLWRVLRSGRKQMMVWGALGCLFILWLWYYRWLSQDPWENGLDFLLLVPAGLMLKSWLAVESTRTLSEDRRSGGLELLLSTPLGSREVVRGQILALRRQFAGPAAAVLLGATLFTAVEIRRWVSAEDRTMLVWMHLLFGGFLALDLWALSWVGGWLGLTQRKPNRAALLALLRVVVLPAAAFAVAITIWVLAKPGSSFSDAAITFWCLTGIAADLYFGLGAKLKMMEEFRTIASEGIKRKKSEKTGAEPAPELVEAG